METIKLRDLNLSGGKHAHEYPALAETVENPLELIRKEFYSSGS